MKTKQIMVSGSSPVRELAGSIVKSYENGEENIELRAIGASSVNQMMKGLAVARSIFAQKGLNMSVRPGFDTVTVDANKNGEHTAETRTVMLMKVDVK